MRVENQDGEGDQKSEKVTAIIHGFLPPEMDRNRPGGGGGTSKGALRRERDLARRRRFEPLGGPTRNTLEKNGSGFQATAKLFFGKLK